MKNHVYKAKENEGTIHDIFSKVTKQKYFLWF